MLCVDEQELSLLIACALERGATPDEIKDIVDRESEELAELRKLNQGEKAPK